MTLRDAIAEIDPEVLLADGLDSAFVGLSTYRVSPPVAVYDYHKCIRQFVSDGMTEEEAVEHMDYNVLPAYVGERTPIYITEVSHDE